jgi:protein phosphatase
MGRAMQTEDATVTRNFAGASHLGHTRQRNEDSYFIAAQRGLGIVADGVGGQGDGAWASRRAVELFVHRLGELPGGFDDRLIVEEALRAVHERLSSETRAQSGKPSGTTIAGVWAPVGSRAPATIFNIGDSSVFHFSGGDLTKVSRDHSLYQLWLDGGRTGREPAKRVITQALGISGQLSPYIIQIRLRPGDAVLVCTDGMSGAIGTERMRELLAGTRNAHEACESLMAEALAGRATDNITVSVCCF